MRIRTGTCDHNVLQRLRDLSHQLAQVKKSAKENYYERLFKNCSSAKDAWRAINSVVATGRTKATTDDIVLKKSSREIRGDRVASEFANYFAGITAKIASEIETRPDDSPNKLNTMKHNISTYFFDPIVPEVIFSSIAALK